MVSRETSISEGLTGLGLAADPQSVGRLVLLCELLEHRAIPHGLVGEADADRIASRHVLESAALSMYVSPSGQLVDVGSGAGLPGLVLACLRTHRTVLVEAQAKRAAFLREAAHELGIAVKIVQSRAEDAAHGALRESAAAVTARALGAVPLALELTIPFARVGGNVVLPIGEKAAGLVEQLVRAADALGGGPPRVVRFEVPGVGERRWVMIVQKLRRTPDRYPRSAGAMRRRPLDGGVTQVI